jgi:hypothetical protein
MRRRNCLLLLATAPIAALAQAPPSGARYRVIEIERFQIASGVTVPDDYLVALDLALMKRLSRIDGIEQVVRANDKTKLIGPVLQLTGTVEFFEPGSRTKRYMVGFGAGKTKLVAKVKFFDKSTGEIVLEHVADGGVSIGAFGGNSMGAARGLAKEIAKAARKQIFQ